MFSTIVHLTRMWKETNDAVVQSIMFNNTLQQFVAQAHYGKDNGEKEVRSQTFLVSHDWVIDTYGEAVANVLVELALTNEFLPVLEAKDGSSGLFQVDKTKISRVKYMVPNSLGNKMEQGKWQGLREDL